MMREDGWDYGTPSSVRITTSDNTSTPIDTVYETDWRLREMNPYRQIPLYAGSDDCPWFDGRGYNGKGSCLSNGHYRCVDCSKLSPNAPRFDYDKGWPLQPNGDEFKVRLTLLEEAIKVNPKEADDFKARLTLLEEAIRPTEKVSDLEGRVEVLEGKVEEAIRTIKEHLEEGKKDEDASTSAGLLGALALLGAIRKPKLEEP